MLNSKVTLTILNPILIYSVPYPNSVIDTNGNHWCNEVRVEEVLHSFVVEHFVDMILRGL